MDSALVAAACALTTGDIVSALQLVSLRSDPPALALRGVAMAQLGEMAKARELLRRARSSFGRSESWARARCVVAEAEISLAMRELGPVPRSLPAAEQELLDRGDVANARLSQLIGIRRLLLLGRIDEAERGLAGLSETDMPAALVATAELLRAQVALRTLRTAEATSALARAREAAHIAGIPALRSEVAAAHAALRLPAARQRRGGQEGALLIHEVEALIGSGALVLDALHRGFRFKRAWTPLASRPILFELSYALAEAWPEAVPREVMILRAFRESRPDETHRARLRVEIGRLRTLLKGMACIAADKGGFRIEPHERQTVALIVPPVEGELASMQALLSDGAGWSTSALARALGRSQRSVQRALADLESAGGVRPIGRGRSQRWIAQMSGVFTPILLLPSSLTSA